MATDVIAQNALSGNDEFSVDFEAIYYLNEDYIQNWQKETVLISGDSSAGAELRGLQTEARLFAQAEDFETASMLLDAAKELIALYGEMPAESLELQSGFVEKRVWFQHTQQIITGTDFWQYKDELAYQFDTTGTDASLNPFAGIRLRGEMQFSADKRLESMAQFKASNEYQDAEFYLRNTIGSNRGNQLVVENRFEGTRETRSFDSQYWGNILNLYGKLRLNDKFAAMLGNDFRIRKYNGKDAFSDSYRQNRLYSLLEFNPTISTRAFARYDFTGRANSTADSLDYREHRLDFTLFQLTTQNTSFFFENIWTRRNYFNSTNPNSFFNSYREENFLGDIRLGLSKLLALGLRADFILRHYDEVEATENTDGTLRNTNSGWIIPDYLNFSANPRFLFKFWGDWQIGVGYLYNLRVYRENIINPEPRPVTDVAATDIPLQTDVLFDDYYSHGISLSLEVFRMDGLMISLTNQYEERRYPNAPEVSGRLFNHDTSINSILLFSSWAINRNFELSTLINFDDEQARNDEFSDVKNTFLSIDLSYTF